jgi:glycosyltransferase involved in cell wall biosynthesis
MSPFFSLIIPIYNLETFLSDCLSSILAQSYQNFEVILVNDGSQDNSQKIIDDFCQKDTRFISFQQENQGVSTARNFGLKHARGEWIWFIDGDDYIHPKALEWIASICNADNSLDCITFKYHTTHQRYEPIATELILSDFSLKKFHCKRSDDLQLVFQNSPIGVWCLCFRRNSAKELYFQPLKQSEDTLFALQLLLTINTIAYTTAKPYYYYQRPGSASKIIDLDHIKNNLKFVEYVVTLAHQEPHAAPYLQVILYHIYIPDMIRRISSINDFQQRREAFETACASIEKLGNADFVPDEYSYILSIARSRSYFRAFMRFHVYYSFCLYIKRHPRILRVLSKIFPGMQKKFAIFFLLFV